MRSEETSLDAVLEVVGIDPLDIELEYTTISSQIARYNELHADALMEQLQAEREAKRVRARTQLFVRKVAIDKGQKMTDKAAEARVETNKKVQAAEHHAIEARGERERLRGIMDTLRGKREMLVSLGAHIRVEMQGNPSIREKMRDRALDELDD